MFSTTGTRSGSRAANGLHGADVGESVGAIAEVAGKRVAEAEEVIKKLVTTQPALALGAALAAGVMIGWLIKRR